ncbi:MAG: dihydroneopterin aldolase family protein [Candidatus Bathyarchaeia archaeon]
MNDEKTASKVFDSTITPRERAIFEGGIALGAICHQFSGIPVSPDKRVLRALEHAIVECMRLTPYKKNIKIKINRKMLRKRGRTPYYYQVLEEKNLDLTVVASYAGVEATVRMKYFPRLGFPLMYVEKVRGTKTFPKHQAV